MLVTLLKTTDNILKAVRGRKNDRLQTETVNKQWLMSYQKHGDKKIIKLHKELKEK